MIQIENKAECNGCCACIDICPNNSITLKTDVEGFWYPVIDKATCVNCSMCEKTCPELYAEHIKKDNEKKPVIYAAIHKNMEVRFDSTSGGLFSAIADIVYSDGGYVGGAVYDKDFSVIHYISNEKKDLQKLRSSKCTQSNASGLYNTIKNLLNAGEKVLVCGTPCQMAGLRQFLNCDYENLIIIDFTCTGVISPKIFRKYLDSIEKRSGSKIVSIKAKSKEFGWRNLTTKFTFENGESLFETKHDSLFTHGHLNSNVFYRPSCNECKFKNSTITDITIADFWGIENIEKSLDNDLGTSKVILNSEKGELLFEQIKSKIECKKVEFESIPVEYKKLTSSLKYTSSINREQFYTDLDISTFDKIAAKYFPRPNISFKKLIRYLVNFILILKRTSRLNPYSILQFIKYNFFKNGVLHDWEKGGFLIPAPNSILEIHKGAKVNIKGVFEFGYKRVIRSKLESRLLVEKGGSLTINGNFTFYYGADIEIFKGGELIINGDGCANINATIICSDKIVLGKDIQIGRNVTIRDNNGGHYISRSGYKNSRPVVIGERAWLCEGCTIMPGVTIGDGAIIGAHSLVLTNIPANCIATGNPAKVIDKDVLWKC